MTLTVPLTLNLSQKKVFTGYAPRTGRYAVQNRITANPVGLDGSSNPDGDFAALAFILAPAAGPYMEGLVEMLDLTNPVHLAIPRNPLVYFRDPDVDLSIYPAGHILKVLGYLVSAPGVVPEVYGLPGEWADEGGDIDGPRDFTVVAEDVSSPPLSGRTKVSTPFLWAARNLKWEMWSPSGSRVAFGTQGVTERKDPSLTKWRDTQFTAAFPEMVAALDHKTYVQVHVKSVAKQANSDPATYVTWQPGNPVNNTY